MLTLEELKEKLAEQFDEYTLLDMLDVKAKELVEKFSDVIEENFEYFEGQIENNSLDYGMLEEEVDNNVGSE